MAAIIDFINSYIWGYVLVYGLLAVGLFFTIRLGFIQFAHFGEMFRVLKGGDETDPKGISPIQALTISLASRVGTGNIVGVAVALTLGGPGAVFWMWMVALVGMATAYAESTLGQLYKIENSDGEYRGGPAFYITRGLGARWAGMLFSFFLILSFGLVFNAVQANSIAEAVEGALGVPRIGIGLVIAVLAGIVIFGGIRQIARVAQIVIPTMAGLYLLMAIVVLVMNASEVPGAIASIFSHAFGFEQAAGGVAGGLMAAMLNGVQRGLFSNEAGMGSAPNIAAAATPHPHHPSAQGFVQALGVFIDTIVICTCTAVIILLSDVYGGAGEAQGAALTQAALQEQFGAVGVYFLAIAIFFFAFTSIIGNYAYAENAMTFLGLDGKVGLTVLRLTVLAMVIWGSYESVATVFNAADASMGLMATINLIAILALSGTVAKLTKDYFAQRKAGKLPRFEVEEYPELQGKISPDIWK
jgi:alanine or glycine:cation symporter, AGCS family